MKAEILATGDEIRTGTLVDSNSAFISEVLIQNGVNVIRHQAVGDDLDTLVAVINEIRQRADIAVVTGGLGPTDDDLSAAAAARAAGVELAVDEQALEVVERFFRERNRPMTPSNRKQAWLPKGAAVLNNPIGTAPGFELTIGHCTFFFLPGVPAEMKKMLLEEVLPRLHARQEGDRRFYLVKTISSFGLPESVVGEKVAGIRDLFSQIQVGWRAKFPEIQVKLYLNTHDEQQGRQLLEDAGRWVAERLGSHVFSFENRSMAAEVGDLLLKRRATLAVAESCTGGLIANWLTNTPGSSDYFLLSAVTYANQAKIDLLGVSAQTLRDFGAVDEQTAREMAEGARRAAKADFGLSTTGIAGPSGGSPRKPVGTVCIGVAAPQKTISRRLVYPYGHRLMNKSIFAMAALDMLRRTLQEENLP
jgi:nicotinamide-nucleotide amidase